ncbi:hypothetical protein [uncultured Flavobacterium sp.]|uniref:hypothetical protein n=1 Tax=uncultured Flavobacterium sp. TaxID=165435 RepID=UPI0025CF9E7C|nr:hypothetical protein [uncultured Flavobacterium sp.]
MTIERPYITGYSNEAEVKFLEVTGKPLAQYLQQYLNEKWEIYTFLYTGLSNRYDNGIQVYQMQFTPLIRAEKLQQAIEALDDSLVAEIVSNTTEEIIAEDESDAPTDWQDYWNYQSRLSGSFANEHLKGSIIQEYASYEDLFRLSDDFKDVFPTLAKLLQKARITRIASIGSGNFYLLGWSYGYGHFGGLMPEPGQLPDNTILPEHELLLRNFGGFIDWFGDSIDSNYFSGADNFELAAAEIAAFEDSGRNFIQFTKEVNGDFFCYNTRTTEVWKSGRFRTGKLSEEYGDDINLIENPAGSESRLYQVQDCSFTDWVERGARAWLNCMEEIPYE